MNQATFLPRFIHARPHLSLAVLLGGAALPLLPSTWSWMTRLLVGWNVVVWIYLVTMMWMMVRAEHEDIKKVAAKQDERGPVILAALCVIAMSSLAAIVSQLSALKDMPAADRACHYALVVITLLGSWFMLGMLFCSHYAHLYYNDDEGDKPLCFPEKNLQPAYWDFLYFSFTIAVAAQTSDVTVCDTRLRRVVLGQSVLSFFFNLAVLGLSINIAASLING
jgi:uncharacterized membrane protein